MSNCKVIALTNQKGGVGKTTTAVNLGVSLAKQGKTVLLVDADAQANLTMALGYTKTDNLPITLSDIMQDIIDGKSVDVQESILHTDEGVDLLPSCVELAGVETTLIDTKNRESVLKACISEVKKNYDYVLIDCMPALGMLTINGLAAADSVIIPNQPHYFSIKGLEQLLRSVSKVKRQINPNLRIDGILMTMVMPRTKITQTVISAVSFKQVLHTFRYNSISSFLASSSFSRMAFTLPSMVLRFLIVHLHINRKRAARCGKPPRSCKIGLLLLPVSDIEPYHRTDDKRHKHYGNNRFSVHSLILLFLSVLKADKAKHSRTCKGNDRKAYPEGRIEVVARFRGIPELVVHLDNRGRTDLDRRLFVGRQDISCGSLVVYFGYGVFANPQIFNEDFAVFVGLKGLVIIRTCDSEREALQLAIRRCLDDFKRASLCGVHKAFACFIFHHIGLTVLLNGYGIDLFIKDKACRCSFLTDEIFAVTEFFHLVNTTVKLRHFTKQLIVLIKLAVFVGIGKYLKDSTRELVVWIILRRRGLFH